jgi:carbamoyl-phosphate synthase small subunit
LSKGKLVLENGMIFSGELFGAEGNAWGEIVFNTALCGYEEILTDPSYYGQVVMMTYPLIGNYGVNYNDAESDKVQANGFIVGNYEDDWCNFEGIDSLSDYLKKSGVTGISGIDTRQLTKIVRSEGAMRCYITNENLSVQDVMKRIRNIPTMTGTDLAGKVTVTKRYELHGKNRFRVAVYDFGIKKNIIREFHRYGFNMMVFPATTGYREILDYKPDGIFLSNGPGDPAAVGYAIENISKLIPSGIPMFGICLGHQLISLALNAKTYKLKFGHRGANHPVRNQLTNRIEITSQNHGFAVDESTLNRDEVEVTHTNLYDGTNEGISHRRYPVFSVQYHPESAPGPNDSKYLFDEFYKIIEENKN